MNGLPCYRVYEPLEDMNDQLNLEYQLGSSILPGGTDATKQPRVSD